MVIGLVAVVAAVLSRAVHHTVVFDHFASAVIVWASEIKDLVIVLDESDVSAYVEIVGSVRADQLVKHVRV